MGLFKKNKKDKSKDKFELYQTPGVDRVDFSDENNSNNKNKVNKMKKQNLHNYPMIKNQNTDENIIPFKWVFLLMIILMAIVVILGVYVF